MRAAYDYNVLETTAEDDWTVVELGRQCIFLNVDASINDAVLGYSYDGVSFGDDMTQPAFLLTTPIPMSCRAYRYKNATPARPATLQVVAYF